METQWTNTLHKYRPRRFDSKTQATRAGRDRNATSQAEDFSRRNLFQGQQQHCVLQSALRSHRSSSDQGAWWTKEVKCIHQNLCGRLK